jgi:hypothetical protein
MEDQIQRAADYIQIETGKLGATLTYTSCLCIARHLHHMWSGKTFEGIPNISQNRRHRYEGDDWDNGND